MTNEPLFYIDIIYRYEMRLTWLLSALLFQQKPPLAKSALSVSAGGMGTRALSLSQLTDLRYKATILVPNFVKKVGTFFGSRILLKRMK